MDVMPTEPKVKSTMRITSELPFTEALPVQPDIDMLGGIVLVEASSVMVA